MVDVWWRVVQETKVTTKYNRDKKLTWGKKAAKTSKTAGVQVGISIRNANFQLGESGKVCLDICGSFAFYPALIG